MTVTATPDTVKARQRAGWGAPGPAVVRAARSRRAPVGSAVRRPARPGPRRHRRPRAGPGVRRRGARAGGGGQGRPDRHGRRHRPLAGHGGLRRAAGRRRRAAERRGARDGRRVDRPARRECGRGALQARADVPARPRPGARRCPAGAGARRPVRRRDPVAARRGGHAASRRRHHGRPRPAAAAACRTRLPGDLQPRRRVGRLRGAGARRAVRDPGDGPTPSRTTTVRPTSGSTSCSP